MQGPSLVPSATDPAASVETEAPILGDAAVRTEAAVQEVWDMTAASPVVVVSVQVVPSPLGLALLTALGRIGRASPSLTLDGGDLPLLEDGGGMPNILLMVSGMLEDAEWGRGIQSTVSSALEVLRDVVTPSCEVRRVQFL